VEAVSICVNPSRAIRPTEASVKKIAPPTVCLCRIDYFRWRDLTSRLFHRDGINSAATCAFDA
jgi:hypothetical protein